MFCKKCGKEVRQEAVFCPNCGAPVSRFNLTGKIFCKHCGARIAAGNSFCSNCGNPIEQSICLTKTQQMRKKNRSFISLLFGMLIFVVIIIVIVGNNGINNNPTNPVEVVYNAITNTEANLNTAKKMLDQLPDPILERVLNDSSKVSEDDLAEGLLTSIKHQAYIYEDSNPSYEIVLSEQLSMNYIEELERDYISCGININIENAFQVEVKGTATTQKGEKRTASMKMISLQINGYWYMDYTTWFGGKLIMDLASLYSIYDV